MTNQHSKQGEPQQQESWQTELQDWIKNQHGSAGWEQKLEAFIQDLLDKKAEKIAARGYRKNKPGWEKISTEVKFYGMGYNDGLDDALSILKGDGR